MVLTDLTHLAGLAPDPQGVTSPTKEGNWGGMSDATTNGMTGGERTESPTNGDENRQEADRVGGV